MEERPIMARVALHAYSLQFKDLDGKRNSIECPYPKDFQTVITQLKKNS
jgi:23S rRNA pseudouridine955/2504/2580 synthase